MYIQRLLVYLFATGCLSALAGEENCGQAEQTPIFASPDIVNIPGNEYGAVLFALLYAYPLPSFSNTFKNKIGLSALGTNGVFSFGRPAMAGDNSVVRPNVDTLYALSILDLAEQDLVLTVPPMQSGRFYLFNFYDPFGDNYASIGSLSKDRPGNYLVRSSLRTGDAGVSSQHCSADYVACVNAPTLNGLMLARIELKNQSSDVKYVNHYINQIKVKKGRKHSPPLAPPFKPSDLGGLSKQKSLRALELLARLGERNPPQNPMLATTLPWIMKYVGLKNDGSFERPGGVNMTEVEKALQQKLEKFPADPENNVALNNGWSYLSPSFSGSFNAGRNLVARAFVAEFAFLQNRADQAIYPTPPKDIYHLAHDEALVLTFFGKPPVRTAGFWSLTIYNSEGALIKNPENIYALGDRSNLTYPNGQAVYGKGGGEDERHFQILVQSAEKKPPTKWLSNWLPSPSSSGGGFQLTMRLFGPGEAATSGEYQYPAITRRKSL